MAPDDAAEGDVFNVLDELARLAFLLDGQRAVAHRQLGACREEAGEHDVAGMGSDVNKAAAAGREVGLGAELRDVDAAVLVNLQKRQQGRVKARALEVGELAAGSHDGVGVGRATKGKAQQRHAADCTLLDGPGDFAMQSFFQQNARHIGRNAKTQVDGAVVRQFHGRAPCDDLLRAEGLELEGAQGLDDFAADGRVVNRLCGLPLVRVNDDVVHQVARHMHVVRAQAAGLDHALDLGDDDAAVVARGQRLVQPAQQGAFMLVGQVAVFIGGGGTDDGHLRHDGREVQPVLSVKAFFAHHGLGGAFGIHRATLKVGVDESAYADLGQHAGPFGGSVTVHVKQDAAGDVVGGQLVLDDHLPDDGHG